MPGAACEKWFHPIRRDAAESDDVVAAIVNFACVREAVVLGKWAFVTDPKYWWEERVVRVVARGHHCGR